MTLKQLFNRLNFFPANMQLPFIPLYL